MNIYDLFAAIEAMDPVILGGAVLATTAIFAIGALAGLLRYLLTAIGYSKMYRKAGVAGWKAFIPVYNTYNNYKISWNGKLFFLFAALFAVASLLGESPEGVMALIGIAVNIGVIFLMIKQNIKMAKRFGKGAGTGIALIFFPGITSLILGLGKAAFIAE